MTGECHAMIDPGKSDPAGSLYVAMMDPPLQKVIRVQILFDTSLFS